MQDREVVQPNLVYIIADEWRAQAIGLLGQDPVLTPAIDAVARSGVVCTGALSTDPVCSPHRAMLMTGQYAPLNGVTDNCNSSTAPMALDAAARCWSDVLKDNGYACGYVGKWHLDAPTEEDVRWGEGPRRTGVVWDTWTPPERRHGFDFWYAYGCCDQHLSPHYWGSVGGPDQRIDVEGWSASHETDVAVDFIRRRRRDRPFALVMSYNPPHMPFDQVPMRLRDLYRDADVHDLLVRPNVDLGTEAGLRAAESVRDYFAAVTGVDEQVGRVVEALRGEGILDQTLVVLTSDHGEAMGSHGLMAKGTWYEESLRVPSIWRLPGVLTPRRDDVLISTPDIHPTLLGLLGLGDQIPKSVQGRDLSSALKGEAGAERPSCAVYAHTSMTDQVGPSRGVLTHQWTYAVRGLPAATEPAPERFLFDNVNDPYQLRNLADVDGAQVREMHELMTTSLAAAGYLPGAS